jgi:multiple antibiotic resistance protein
VLADQKLFLTQLVTLLAVLDPVSHLTLFLTSTGALQHRDRRRVALLAVPLAFVILVAFGFAGQYVLHAMGISLLSFQIAGGIIILLFSLTMVLGPAETGPAPEHLGGSIRSLAVYPLAVPVLAGPGSILTIMVLMDNNRGSLPDQLLTVLALAVVFVVLLGVFSASERISRVIGEGGANVLRRIMGLILASLSVNLILNAFALWLRLPPI